ncbi:GspH/FimT family pseudopilin [Thiofilum flexile]|uniref:GspH/FimT family pseudopilin n=1 Tax=Thiofilum flexile TaxID=125627 RepID=UPI000360380C|nr:GspH/FimT family pseudopilin [Thiofilum flexile]
MPKHMQGVTLVELMIALVLLSVLVAVATPSLKEFTERNRATAITNQMLSYFSLARSEAAKRSYNVVACIRNTAGTGCDSNATDFSQGIFIFVDYSDGTKPANNTYDDTNIRYDLNFDNIPDSYEEIIFQSEPSTSSYEIITSRASTIIPFAPNGAIVGARLFNLKVQRKEDSKLLSKVVFSMSGRMRSCFVPKNKDDC